MVGSLSGYIAGDFLVRQWHWPHFVFYLCMIAGFCASILEVVRLIMFTIRLATKD